MILVTGATGSVGSNVVRGLRDAGVRVRAFVRDPGRAATLLGDDIELAVGDFADAASVRQALNGVDTAFLACSNHPQQVAYETGFIDAAVAAGAQRVIKLSVIGAQRGSRLAFWDQHAQIEEHLRRSSLRSVLLRPSGFMTLALMAADSVRQQSAIFAPAAGARMALIDPRDVADVAVLALCAAQHDGAAYELTGAEVVTYEQIADAISEVTGRRIRFVNVPDEAARETLLAAGLPPWLAAQVVTLFGLLREGAIARVTDTFRTLTGREPRSLRTFIRDRAQVFQQPLSAV